MPSIDQIRESLEARIVELRSEINSLQSARAALHKNGGGPTATTARAKRPARPEPRRAATTTVRPAQAPDATATVGATDDGSGGTAVKATGAARKPRARIARPTARRRKPVEVLLAGKLEAMPGEAADGLSATAIARQANARESQVRELLQDLENAGQVQRTGTGRGTQWRLVSDEERIARRVAELEKLALRKP